MNRNAKNKIRIAQTEQNGGKYNHPSQTWVGIPTPVDIITDNDQLLLEDEINNKIDKLKSIQNFKHLNSIKKLHYSTY